MAADVEEVVSRSDTIDGENRLPDADQLPFEVVSGLGDRRRQMPGAVQPWQRLAIDLAGGRDGQFLQEHEPGGNHVRRQLLP